MSVVPLPRFVGPMAAPPNLATMNHSARSSSPNIVSASALARTARAFALIWAGLLIAAGNVYIAGLNTVAGACAQNPAQATTTWLAMDYVH